MGREIRRVPANWEHPKDDEGHCLPMYDEDFDTAIRKWFAEYCQWQEGTHPDQHENWTFIDWDGGPPDPEYCRPAFTDEPTHYQIYQTVSEGTPTSPVFASLDEMKDWLIGEGHSETAASRFVDSGWAPSFVMSSEFGVSGIGIDAHDQLAQWPERKAKDVATK